VVCSTMASIQSIIQEFLISTYNTLYLKRAITKMAMFKKDMVSFKEDVF